MSNLRLVKEYITTSGATRLNFTDLFTTDFDCFQVIIDGKADSSASGGHMSLINANGGRDNSSNYEWALRYMKGNAGDGDLQNSGVTDWAYTCNVYDTTGGTSVYYFFNPAQADKYTYLVGVNATTTSGDSRAYRNIGMFKKKASMTGISMDMDNNMTAIVRSYGIGIDT
tara:strand:+ start:303 stop:812 length:510 start_codon:yes stop_codon:yes gene_type:complete